MSNAAKPGFFKKTDHVSLTVLDLNAVIEFYRKVFGAKLLYRLGPFDSADMPAAEDGRDWTEAHVNVRGACLEIAMMQLDESMKMELFRYSAPADARQEPPRNCDTGSRHLCFEVGDIHKAVEYLRQNGCKALSGPITMQDAPCPDSHSWYVLDPFGNQLELVEYL